MSWARIRRGSAAGRPVFVKETDYDARLEADGLEALRQAGAPVPEVLEADENRIVMEELSGTPAWRDLGRALAICHRHTAPEFGYHHDNVIGPLPQANPWTASWSEFYIEHRLLPHLDCLPSDLAVRLGRSCEGDLLDLLERDQPPSLIHGDLWSGNIIDGAWLIDPAVSFADRELDPAFAGVFGGIPQEMWEGYREEWPLDDGWEQRRPALQLYHLLIHVRLFGGGYTAMVADRLDALGL